MPISQEKLMQYDSFSDYALDNHLQDLFRPGEEFHNSSDIILKVDDKSVTLLRNIILFGTHP
jgi:hypothetical protein